MTSGTTDGPQNDLIKFIRQRDYIQVRELGQGACGKTVLLHDKEIDSFLVCKKFTPYDEGERQRLFDNFTREIKLMYALHHENVVRIFNHYLYKTQMVGYILMEYIDGSSIADYVRLTPNSLNALFPQAVRGFAYLHGAGVLHRDIRSDNLLVDNSGRLKIIDLGFGKEVQGSDGFTKSINLNWICASPKDFSNGKYDFCTEIYFVGRLFEQLLESSGAEDFRHASLVQRMCAVDPGRRIQTFSEIERALDAGVFTEYDFSDAAKTAYRDFAESLRKQVLKLDINAKYVTNIDIIERRLSDAYNACLLEVYVPNPTLIASCFIDGRYWYSKSRPISVDCVRKFLALFRTSTENHKRVILANVHTTLDALPREQEIDDSDIPF